MFTLLVTEQKKPRLWHRAFGLGARLEEHHTLDIPWRLIRADCGPNGPNWEKIERLAGRHRARIVSSSPHLPPQGSRVELAKLHGLDRMLAAWVICRLLENQPQQEAVGVYDPAARCLSAVEALLEQAKCVTVYTRQPHRYEWFARRMLRLKGAPVLLCGSPKGMESCRKVLLGGISEGWQEWIPPECAVFSAVGERSVGGRLVVSEFVPQCSEKLLSQIPKGVPLRDICGALYQLASLREMDRLSVKSCRVGGVGMDMPQLEKMFETRG